MPYTIHFIFNPNLPCIAFRDPPYLSTLDLAGGSWHKTIREHNVVKSHLAIESIGSNPISPNEFLAGKEGEFGPQGGFLVLTVFAETSLKCS